MAQQPEYSPIHEPTNNVEGGDETKDRGMLDFLEKKEEQKPNDEMSVTKFAEAHVLKSEDKMEEEEEDNKPSVIPKLEHSDNSSCPSRDVDGENKGLKEKLTGEEKKEEQQHHQDGVVGGHNVTHSEEIEEMKSFMEKIREKLSGAPKKSNTDEKSAPVVNLPAETGFPKEKPEEKNGFMEKIKDKLPGHNKNGAAETQEKESNGVTH